ncbi:MAG: hypothetical protein ACLSFT_00090 [Ruminococcus callidus]
MAYRGAGMSNNLTADQIAAADIDGDGSVDSPTCTISFTTLPCKLQARIRLGTSCWAEVIPRETLNKACA